MSELKITQEKVTAAFSEANDCPKAISILTALFGKQKPDYTDYHNIKTYRLFNFKHCHSRTVVKL